MPDDQDSTPGSVGGDGQPAGEPIREAAATAPERAIAPAEVEEGAPAAVDEAEPKFFIVGVGASAGGLEAIAALIKDVTLDGAALVVVQHLARTHESFLP